MTDDAAARLRAQLDRLTGSARVRPLLELGRIYADRHWKAGPGTPAAEPDLASAVKVLREAYGYIDQGDTLRAYVAAQLGWLLGSHSAIYGGSAEDREAAIGLLEEGLAWAGLPPIMRATARLNLGTLLLYRVMRALQPADISLHAAHLGASPAIAADADRAVECIRQVLAEEQVSTEIATTARVMLKAAEGVRNMVNSLGKGIAGVDLNSMVEAMTTFQNLQQQAQAANATAGAGIAPMVTLFNTETLLTREPIDWPVTVVEGPEPAESPAPRPPRPEPAPVDLQDLRRRLRDTVGGGTDPYVAAADLLRPEAPPPGTEVVDEMVGLATSVIHQAGAAATAEDHLLLAVALHLRTRTGGDGGWADDEDGGDAKDVMESVLTAVERLTAGDLDAVPVIIRLTAILDGERRAGQLLDRLADRFTDPANALRSAGVEALARRCPEGVLLLDTATGRLRMADPDQPLPQRILIVGEQLPDRDVTASYVSSARQALEAVRRTPMEVTRDPVFVVNPRGNRGAAAEAAVLLRRTFYPRSSDASTPDEVRARLGASLLHLDCGITATGALELAGSAELAPETIASWGGGHTPQGGLAVLPPSAGGYVPLADALLGAGFTGVVGWLHPVPQPVAALMLYVLHAELVRGGLPPATAVRAVRDWMRDKRRRTLDGLPESHIVTIGRRDLTDPRYWTALVHRGA